MLESRTRHFNHDYTLPLLFHIRYKSFCNIFRRLLPLFSFIISKRTSCLNPKKADYSSMKVFHSSLLQLNKEEEHHNLQIQHRVFLNQSNIDSKSHFILLFLSIFYAIFILYPSDGIFSSISHLRRVKYNCEGRKESSAIH